MRPTTTSPGSGSSNSCRSPRPSSPGVTPYLAPDATALGQIFWYTVEGRARTSASSAAIQDWYVRYQLNSVPGVAEVASVGGAPRVSGRRRPEQAPGLRDQPGRGLLGRAAVELGRRRPGHPEGERRVPHPLRRLDRSLRDIENTVVAQRNGTPICVEDTLGHGAARGLPPGRPGEGRQRGRSAAW